MPRPSDYPDIRRSAQGMRLPLSSSVLALYDFHCINVKLIDYLCHSYPSGGFLHPLSIYIYSLVSVQPDILWQDMLRRGGGESPLRNRADSRLFPELCQGYARDRKEDYDLRVCLYLSKIEFYCS